MIWILLDTSEYLFDMPLAFSEDELAYEFLCRRFLDIEKTGQYWEDHWEDHRRGVKDEHIRRCCVEDIMVIPLEVHHAVPHCDERGRC